MVIRPETYSMRKPTSGGGWPAIGYALKMARKSGGIRKFMCALRSRNACKTCALGMGGQRGGMVDETGRFREVCKKSMQAMAADMQPRIPADFFQTNGFERLRCLSPRELEHLGRLVEPLYAGPEDTHYRPISWDEAVRKCADHLKASAPDECFFYASGRSSNEAGFLLQLFARLYGTNNVNNCSYYCHQASGVGLGGALGTGTATVVLEDLDRCDLVFLIGGNPASNHPRLLRKLMEVRRRGGSVVVINPIKETGLARFSVPSDTKSLIFGSTIASHYVQPHIGGDIALLLGIAKAIISRGGIDDRFIAAATDHWDAFRDHVRSISWEAIESSAGVSREQIEELADVYAKSSATIFAWTMVITHHLHGVDNVRAIVNLGLMRGMVGKSGAGLLPIRGHSNVQGIGSIGVTPALKKAVFDRLEQHFHLKLPTTTGLDTLSCLSVMQAGTLRHGMCLGGNLHGASPDAKRTETTFQKLDSIVYLSTTLNTGHVRGRARETIVLPVLARDEEPQATTQESMFSFVRLSDGGPRRHEGPQSEVAVLARIARCVLGDDGPIDWRSMEKHRSIREAIAAVVPGYEAIGDIDATKQEFQISGRTFHRPKFATENGRARFHAVAIPPAVVAEAGQLRLMTIRSEGQFNTVVYEEEDLYRHQERRDVILMNVSDMARLGLAVDQQVCVRSAVGEMSGILVRAFDIRAGNAAMYFPEANVLVPDAADPESRTPAFKSVIVRVSAER